MSIRCTGEKCKLGALTKDVTVCTAHNCPDRTLPLTNADRIRAMSDEELAEVLINLAEDVGFCLDMPECNEDLEQDREIPHHRCRGCALNWLHHPAEGAET